MLNTVFHGTPTDRPPLLIAHGLFGSARNWNVIAKRLSDERQVLVVVMRNHGDSFHAEAHRYEDLAADLAGVLDRLDRPADLLGHSMGGKAAMVLALRHPQALRRLIVADIAPVAYSHSQMHLIEAMRALPLTDLTRRSEADAALAGDVPDAGVRAFLLQSLDLTEGRWRLNLDALAAAMDDIIGWPEDVTGQFDAPALFLTGATSDYVQPAHRDRIRALFPAARFARLNNAGHWLHAEQPRAFESSIRVFLNA